jgi:soluble lytic murein transglycosylase-like protein
MKWKESLTGNPRTLCNQSHRKRREMFFGAGSEPLLKACLGSIGLSLVLSLVLLSIFGRNIAEGFVATTAELKTYAEQQANAYGIPPDIFLNLITTESNWNPSAISPANAQGIAQLEPGTAPNIDRFNPFESLKFAAQLLSSYFAKYGDWSLALAAYNAGPGAVATYGGIPPYAETQDYVRKILGNSTPASKEVSVQSLKIFFWAAVVIVAIVVVRGVAG